MTADLPVLPQVIVDYFAAAQAYDFEALASCFAPDGVVSDEGDVFRGRGEIVAWREALAVKWRNTYEITGAEILGAADVRVTAHLEGTFPGGVVDLNYGFSLADGLIARLEIS
jgi:ketosteroid isomerase-like protein